MSQEEIKYNLRRGSQTTRAKDDEGVSALKQLFARNFTVKPKSFSSNERLNRFKFQCQLQTTEAQILTKQPQPGALSPPTKTEVPATILPIVNMGLNYMSKMLMFATSQSLNVYSIPRSKVTCTRTFADIFNEPQGKSDLYTIENLQPLILKNIWVAVKNKKQLVFFNSHLDKGTDPAADSNGIIDIKVNQKSEEIFSVTKDYKQIRIWIYEILDRNPKKSNYSDNKPFKKFSHFEVTISNRKNIYFNMGVFQFNIISEMDVLVVQSSGVNEISIWSTCEGAILYNFSLDTFQKIPIGQEDFSGSSFTKDVASKAGASSHKNQGIVSQVLLESKKFHFNVVGVYQEYIVVFSNNFKRLLIWDIFRQESVLIKTIKEMKGPIVNIFVEPTLDLYSGGIYLINDSGMIYEFCVGLGRIHSLSYDIADRKQVQLNIEDSDEDYQIQQPLIKNVFQQYFMHAQHKKLKELEVLYPHAVQDNDYPLLQAACKYYFLQIENGCRQLYIQREQSIDIVEIFTSGSAFFELKSNSQHEKIMRVTKDEYLTSPDQSNDFLTLYSTQGEIAFIKVADLKRKEENQCGFNLSFKENCFFHINANDILSQCIDHVLTSDGTPKGGLDDDLRSSPTKSTSLHIELNHKQANLESFLRAPIAFTAFDFDIGILAYYNTEGMVAVINLFTMVRKFIQFGFQGNILRILLLEKDNHDNLPYLTKKASHLNYQLHTIKRIMGSGKFTWDEYSYIADPNYSLVLVCENDLIEIRNEVKTNLMGFKNKIPFNDKIVDVFYLKDKLQMYALCRDGTVKDIETESFTVTRVFKLYWEDVSSVFLNPVADALLLTGYSKGIITSQFISSDLRKHNTLERKFQVHNFHRQEIVSVSQPKGVTKQFVSICKENIVCLWLIDNERPYKVCYFNNYFQASISLSSSLYTLDKEQTIDKVILVGNYKLFEVHMSSASYYRAYDEEQPFIWDCFAYDINKQIINIRKNIQESKAYEYDRRFKLKDLELGQLLQQKQDYDRFAQGAISINQDRLETHFSVGTPKSIQDATLKSSQDDYVIQEAPVMHKTYNFAKSRLYFTSLMNTFMVKLLRLQLPQRLIEYEYHIFLKQSALNKAGSDKVALSELEKKVLGPILGLDYQYLKLIKGKTKEEIVASSKILAERDKASQHMIKIKEQNEKINSQLKSGDEESIKKIHSQREQEQEILMKTQELSKLVEQRKNYPATMMGLMKVPEVKKKEVISLTTRNQDKTQPNPLQIASKEPQPRRSSQMLENREGEALSPKSQAQKSQNTKQGSSTGRQRSKGFTIQLPQITMSEFSNQLVGMRDSLKSREQQISERQLLDPKYKGNSSLNSEFDLLNLQSRRDTPEGKDSKRVTYDEFPKDQQAQQTQANQLLISSDFGAVRRPFVTSKVTEHMISNPAHQDGFQKPSGRSRERKKVQPERTEKHMTFNQRRMIQKSVSVQKLGSLPGSNRESDQLQASQSLFQSSMINTLAFPSHMSSKFDLPLTQRGEQHKVKIDLNSIHQQMNYNTSRAPHKRFFSNQKQGLAQSDILQQPSLQQSIKTLHPLDTLQNSTIDQQYPSVYLQNKATDINNSLSKVSSKIPIETSLYAGESTHQVAKVQQPLKCYIEEQVAPRVIDSKQFWDKYHSKLNLVKKTQDNVIALKESNRLKHAPFGDLKIKSQKKNLGINQYQQQQPQHEGQRSNQIEVRQQIPHNESKAHMSTEPNSRIINERSVEEDSQFDSQILHSSRQQDQTQDQNLEQGPYDLQTFSALPLKVKGLHINDKQSLKSVDDKVGYFDSVTYIENFFQFKADPNHLLAYFDSQNIDIEELSKDELKNLLNNYIKQVSGDPISNKERVLRLKHQQMLDRMRRDEINRMKFDSGRSQLRAKDQELYKVMYQKFMKEQQEILEAELKKAQEISTKQIAKLVQSQNSLGTQQEEAKRKANREGLERYIQENIIQKWIVRKVFKCVDMLERGIPMQDVISRVCPEADFDEVRQNYNSWKTGKVKKDNRKKSNGSQKSDDGGRKGSAGPQLGLQDYQADQNQTNVQSNAVGVKRDRLLDQVSRLEGFRHEYQSASSIPIRNESQENLLNQDLQNELNPMGMRGGRQEKINIQDQDEGQVSSQEFRVGSAPNIQDGQRSKSASKLNSKVSSQITTQGQNSRQRSQRITKRQTKPLKNNQTPTIKADNETPVPKNELTEDEPSVNLEQQEKAKDKVKENHKKILKGANSQDTIAELEVEVSQDTVSQVKPSVEASLGSTVKLEPVDIKKVQLMNIIEDSKSEGNREPKMEEKKLIEQKDLALRALASAEGLNRSQTNVNGRTVNQPLETLSKLDLKAKGLTSQNTLQQKYQPSKIEQPKISNIQEFDIQLSQQTPSEIAIQEMKISVVSSQSLYPTIQPGGYSSILTKDLNIDQIVYKPPNTASKTASPNISQPSSAKSTSRQKSQSIKDEQTGLHKRVLSDNGKQKRESSKESQDSESQGNLLNVFKKGIATMVTGRGSGSMTGNDPKRKSSQIKDLGNISSKSLNAPLSQTNAQKRRMSVMKVNALESPNNNNKNTDSEFQMRQDSIEEVSEDSENMIIDVQLEDVAGIKDKLFSMISEDLFDSSPEERIERIKLATFLETMTIEEMQEMGIKFNGRRDNYVEIMQQIKVYQKNQQAANKQGFKLNKKSFAELKKRLLPGNSNVKASDFIAALTGSPKKVVQKDVNGADMEISSYMNQLHHQMSQNMATEEDENDGQLEHKYSLQDCQSIIGKLFEGDGDFNYFKGRLKEYRMRFAQQTQFVESVKDVEEADKRDYATFDRLEVFRRQNEKMKEVLTKQKKFDQTKDLVRDAPAGSGIQKSNRVDGAYYINFEGDDDDEGGYQGKSKISLAALQEEVMNTFLEVKKKNRKLEEKKAEQQDERLQLNKQSSEIQSQEISKIHESRILKKYRINLDEKRKFEELSEIERMERRYGIMLGKNPDYLNPQLSQKYIERQYFKSQTSRVELPDIKKVKYKKPIL